jgi:hypothetical protein
VRKFLPAKDIAACQMPMKLVAVTARPRNPVGRLPKRDRRVGEA